MFPSMHQIDKDTRTDGAPNNEPAKNMQHEVANLINDFNSGMWIEGITDRERVTEPIRVLYGNFRRVIHGTAPEFRPFSKLQEQGNPLPRPNFLEDEEGLSGEEPNDFGKNRPIYVDEVYQQVEE
jgi:hypothetical protein